MSFYYLQGGTSLQRMNASTGVLTTLTLPTGVTLDATKRGRFAVLGRNVVLVNSPTVNLVIDEDGIVRPLCLPPPGSAPRITASGTGLTGDYIIRETFVLLDSEGRLFAESPMGPMSAVFTAANQGLSVSGCAVSPFATYTPSARRQYRTTAGGSLFYELLDVDGNAVTAYIDNTSDASLALLPSAPTTLGVPPGTLPGDRLKIIVSWRNRLFAVADTTDLRDYLIYTEELKHYAWPAENRLKVNPVGADLYGVVGLIPRRDELNILKRDRIMKLTGFSNDDFQVYGVVEGVGCVSPDTIAVIRDVGYWLGEDGVYRIGPGGVENISREKVHAWFTTDTYFNRTRFPNAFAHYNQRYDSYELYLANAGDSTENRWVSYSLKKNEWLGPHKTGAFTPSLAAAVRDDDDIDRSVICSTSGFVYLKNQTALTDGAATAIEFDLRTKYHSADSPDIEKMWLEPSVLTRIESGGTLTITPYIGRLNASAGTAISHDLTLGRQRLRRLGRGALMQLRFTQGTNAQGVAIYGYEVPYFEVGRR